MSKLKVVRQGWQAQGDRLINECQRSFQTLGDMRPDADDDRMTLEDMEDIPSMSITERDRESPAFITVENEKGVIEHVQVRLEPSIMVKTPLTIQRVFIRNHEN